MRSYIYALIAGTLLLSCTAPVVQHTAEVAVRPDDSTVETRADFIIQPARIDIGEVVEGDPAHARLFVRNTGFMPLHIMRVESACGCTVSALGSHEVPPGGFTTLDVTIDTTAKGDSVDKQVSVVDALGRRATATLHLRVNENPHAGTMPGRGIFSGRCASCHYEPAAGKVKGKDIYQAVCAMCHGADGEGAYAPRLRGMEADSLSLILSHGIDRRMPAFARSEGGPLTPKQIADLAQWLSGVDEPR